MHSEELMRADFNWRLNLFTDQVQVGSGRHIYIEASYCMCFMLSFYTIY